MVSLLLMVCLNPLHYVMFLVFLLICLQPLMVCLIPLQESGVGCATDTKTQALDAALLKKKKKALIPHTGPWGKKKQGEARRFYFKFMSGLQL